MSHTTTSTANISTMQLQIRGQETTVIECQNNEKIQHIKVFLFLNSIIVVHIKFILNLFLDINIQGYSIKMII